MRRSKSYSDKELINMVMSDAKRLGRTPKLNELSYRGTLINRFGSYSKVLELSNLKPNRVFYNRLFGKKFNQLTAIRQEGEKWLCQCDCGNNLFVYPNALVNGGVKRCRNCAIPYLKTNEAQKKIDEKYRKEGSFLPALKRKKSKKNKTGVKGVSWVEKKQRYVASLKFQGRSYHLGNYKTLEEARKARLAGEEKYYRPFLEKWESESVGEFNSKQISNNNLKNKNDELEEK